VFVLKNHSRKTNKLWKSWLKPPQATIVSCLSMNILRLHFSNKYGITNNPLRIKVKDLPSAPGMWVKSIEPETASKAI